MADVPSLTTSQLASACTDVLVDEGYAPVVGLSGTASPPEGIRLFEDPFGIVAIAVYPTWATLSAGWPRAQGWLVDVISSRVGSAEAKSWDGYLVLLTSAPLPVGSTSECEGIRYDTKRVRKLVATGEDLTSLSDVRHALLPVLPLSVGGEILVRDSALDQLPVLLENHGIRPDVTRRVVEAFVHQRSMMDALHDLEREQ